MNTDLRGSILIFQRLIPLYRVPFFRYLYKECGTVVCYSRTRKGSSLKSAELIDIPVILLKRIIFPISESYIYQKVLPTLFRIRPPVVVCEGSPSYLTLWILLLYRFFFRYKLIIWTHGIRFYELDKPFTSMRGKVLRWLYNQADGLIVYSDSRAGVIKKHIHRPQKVFVARNTIDTSELLTLYTRHQTAGKEKIKQELGITHHKNIVFIGRLVPRKRIDILLKAFALIPVTRDIGLQILGNGPDEALVRQYAEKYPNIHYHGPVYDMNLNTRFLYASDLMVMPGYVGLAIVHAFAMGCPVITCVSSTGINLHSPEIEYLKHGINGLVCDLIPEELASLTVSLLEDDNRLKSLSRQALHTAYHEADLKHMLTGFQNAFSFVKNL